jgi:hypothetical protein
MTRQEALNRVWQVFVVDKAPQSKSPEGCEYGDPDKTVGCAVACLCDRETRLKLREWELALDFECTGIGAFDGTILSGEVEENEKNFLTILQSIHDNYHSEGVGRTFDRYMADRLRALAEDYSSDHPLTIPE